MSQSPEEDYGTQFPIRRLALGLIEESVTHWEGQEGHSHPEQNTASANPARDAIPILHQRLNDHDRDDRLSNPPVPINEDKFVQALNAPGSYIHSRTDQSWSKTRPTHAEYFAVKCWSQLLKDLNAPRLHDER